MSVTNELRHLALYLDELIDTGNGLEVGSSLYEQVQYNNSIIPRLYLMITGNGMNTSVRVQYVISNMKSGDSYGSRTGTIIQTGPDISVRIFSVPIIILKTLARSGFQLLDRSSL